MTNFDALRVPASLVQSLERMSITTPTPIQVAAIPPALEGSDILASAQTGTGKTLAFVLPILANLDPTTNQSALIMTPTRELAVQIKATVDKILGKGAALKTALLIGGEPMPKQLDQLRGRPHLVIGTPGRINDHLRRSSLKLHDTRFLVLDETDRMLDMGFTEQIDIIIDLLPEQHQTLMFSATLPPVIVKMSQRYLTNPERITIGSTSQPVAKIKQDTRHVSGSEKFSQLVEELEAREGSVIVFVKTKRGAEQLAGKLRDHDHSVAAIHGDLRQNKRDQVIRAFRSQKSRIMVATDIAARGLDVPHIQHVINYDLPQCPEDFIHRIGRTARAGAEGNALSFISPEDRNKWRMIHRLMNPGEKMEAEPFRKSAPRGKDSGQRGGFSKGGFAKKSFGKEEFSQGRSSRPAGRRDEDGTSSTRRTFKGGKSETFESYEGGRSPRRDKPAFGASEGGRSARRDKPAFGASEGGRSARRDKPAFESYEGGRSPRRDKPAFESYEGGRSPRRDKPAFESYEGGRSPRRDKPAFEAHEGGRSPRREENFSRRDERGEGYAVPRRTSDRSKPFSEKPSYGKASSFNQAGKFGKPLGSKGTHTLHLKKRSDEDEISQRTVRYKSDEQSSYKSEGASLLKTKKKPQKSNARPKEAA